MRTLIALGLAAQWCVSAASADIIPVNDWSFESGVAELATPLVDPPLSGVVGGWEVDRFAAGIITGLTAPRIGIVSAASAPDGAHVGRMLFAVGIVANARFSQELKASVEPGMRYTLMVDVGTAGLASVMATAAVRVYAGESLLATSEDPMFLNVFGSDGFDTYVLTFCSGNIAFEGNLRIELAAEATLALLSGVAFDNVRFSAVPFSCPCNVNGDCTLNSQDFFDYLTLFFNMDVRSDSNGDGQVNSQDFFDFLQCFFGELAACE